MRPFSKILCIVEPNKTMDTAIVQSLRIAEDHQADITFISVQPAAKSWRIAFHDKEKCAKEGNEIAQRRRAEIEQRIQLLAPAVNANIVLAVGIAFIEIIKYAIHHQHDLVIKCAEEMNWSTRMLGSEDMHLLRKCPCPVLMLKPEQKNHFRKILATVDVSNDSTELDAGSIQDQLNQQVLEYSAALCMPELSEMHIGSVWEASAESFLRHSGFSNMPEEEVDQYVDQRRKECLTKLEELVRNSDKMLGKAAVQYLQPKLHFLKGEASKDIPLLVENLDVDLIVMGTVGRVGIPGFIIGNTAESILDQTKCSVLAIKPEGFKTPIE